MQEKTTDAFDFMHLAVEWPGNNMQLTGPAAAAGAGTAARRSIKANAANHLAVIISVIMFSAKKDSPMCQTQVEADISIRAETDITGC